MLFRRDRLAILTRRRCKARGCVVATTLFKQVGYSVTKLIEDIESGEIGLPDIQRPFVWSKAKVRDLFDSMYGGFPVGYLLFWAKRRGPGCSPDRRGR